MPQDPLETLIARIAKGDRPALAELFAREAPRLKGVARRIVRRDDLAEDVIQDAFLRVWRSADGFDPARGSAQGWLSTIVRNRALNTIRDSARIEITDPADTVFDHDGRGGDIARALDQLDQRDALRICLDRLDAGKRDAILLCYVTGLNHGEAAATMKQPLGTVKSWVRRGVIALQECLS